jgi:hemerythrin-like domain-containing protein
MTTFACIAPFFRFSKHLGMSWDFIGRKGNIMATKAIETLMNEHRVIEQVLGSLAAFARDLDEGPLDQRPRVAEYAEFFREFADQCHHGKEEDRLFKALTDQGFPANGGPIAVMLHEHEEGRTHVRALAEIGAGAGALSSEECDRVRHHALEFVPLLRQHIRKEDEILFPAAERALPPAVLAALAEDFERHEREEMGSGEHERLHRLAENLIEAHAPPATAGPQRDMTFGSPCGH